MAGDDALQISKQDWRKIPVTLGLIATLGGTGIPVGYQLITKMHREHMELHRQVLRHVEQMDRRQAELVRWLGDIHAMISDERETIDQIGRTRCRRPR